MKVAVIGAGLAGMASACYLLVNRHDVKVHIFDPKGIGQGGASKVASGLLHPYPGEKGRRSLHAKEALAAAHFLLDLAQKYTEKKFFTQGVLRRAMTAEQKEIFAKHMSEHQDISLEGCLENGFMDFAIQSGITVSIPEYLQSLWKFCSSHGALLHLEKIPDPSKLNHFDRIIIAAGAGIKDLPQGDKLPLKYIKGQILIARSKTSVPHKSIIGKGYAAASPLDDNFHLGSTYEHYFSNAFPNSSEAEKIIVPRLKTFLPWADQMDILGCQAGIRVANRNHYFPMVKKVTDTCLVVTGLGSRGLLYHGLLGKKAAEEILQTTH